jgi:hypothetical protein
MPQKQKARASQSRQYNIAVRTEIRPVVTYSKLLPTSNLLSTNKDTKAMRQLLDGARLVRHMRCPPLRHCVGHRSLAGSPVALASSGEVL